MLLSKPFPAAITPRKAWGAGSNPVPLTAPRGSAPSLEHTCQLCGASTQELVPTQPLPGPIPRPHSLGAPSPGPGPPAKQPSTSGCSWTVRVPAPSAGTGQHKPHLSGCPWAACPSCSHGTRVPGEKVFPWAGSSGARVLGPRRHCKSSAGRNMTPLHCHRPGVPKKGQPPEPPSSMFSLTAPASTPLWLPPRHSATG